MLEAATVKFAMWLAGLVAGPAHARFMLRHSRLTGSIVIYVGFFAWIATAVAVWELVVECFIPFPKVTLFVLVLSGLFAARYAGKIRQIILDGANKTYAPGEEALSSPSVAGRPARTPPVTGVRLNESIAAQQQLPARPPKIFRPNQPENVLPAELATPYVSETTPTAGTPRPKRRSHGLAVATLCVLSLVCGGFIFVTRHGGDRVIAQAPSDTDSSVGPQKPASVPPVGQSTPEIIGGVIRPSKGNDLDAGPTPKVTVPPTKTAKLPQNLVGGVLTLDGNAKSNAASGAPAVESTPQQPGWSITGLDSITRGNDLIQRLAHTQNDDEALHLLFGNKAEFVVPPRTGLPTKRRGTTGVPTTPKLSTAAARKVHAPTTEAVSARADSSASYRPLPDIDLANTTQLVGKKYEDIVRMFGRPDSDETNTDGIRHVEYRDRSKSSFLADGSQRVLAVIEIELGGDGTVMAVHQETALEPNHKVF